MSIIQEITIIGEEYLKQNTVLNLQIDTDKLRPAIVDAQTINIQSILGTDLLVKILTDIDNNNLINNYQLLTDNYIIPAMLKWSLYYATLDISFQMYNKGVMQRTSEFAQPSSIKDIQVLRNEIKNNAEFLSQRLNHYLCDNSSLFPEYNSTNDLESQKNNIYDSGGFVFKSRPNFPFIRKSINAK
jgi:hypothetical protein